MYVLGPLEEEDEFSWILIRLLTDKYWSVLGGNVSCLLGLVSLPTLY